MVALVVILSLTSSPGRPDVNTTAEWRRWLNHEKLRNFPSPGSSVAVIAWRSWYRDNCEPPKARVRPPSKWEMARTTPVERMKFHEGRRCDSDALLGAHPTVLRCGRNSWYATYDTIQFRDAQIRVY
jgi:hypothetical protein